MHSSYIFAILAAASVVTAVGIEQVGLYNFIEGFLNNDVMLGEYTPTCEGNCFQFPVLMLLGPLEMGFIERTASSMWSLPPEQDHATLVVRIDVGTDTEVLLRYSDYSCQDYIGETGNHVGIDLQCNETELSHR